MAGGDLVDGCCLLGCGLVIKKPGRGWLVAFITASAVGCLFWSDPKAAEKAAVVREADKTRSDERRAVLCCMPAKAGNKRWHCGLPAPSDPIASLRRKAQRRQQAER